MYKIRMELLIAGACLILASCGADTEPAPTGSEDGTQKSTGGKGDAWDWRNNPSRFQADLNYNWTELPLSGNSDKVAWADTYWPTYEDSVNARWQGHDTLSPVEKWDKAMNGWEMADGFMDLKPYDSNTCEWDDAYYEGLGPAASWTSKNKGNWRSHNGIDDDDDGIEDQEECGYGDDTDRDGVETWWGLCHAWVPAAILEDEPLKAVEHNGVTFETADLKALLVLQYDRSDAFMLGGRCNEKDVERDDSGRLAQSQCRDVNAGSFHVIVTNFLGLQSRAIAEDRTYDYEVWNQPVVSYEITEQTEMTAMEVNELLNVEAAPDEEAQPVTAEEISGVLDVANLLDETELVEDVGLREEEAKAIVEARNGADEEAGTADDVEFTDLDMLTSVFNVGPRVLTRLLNHAREEGLAPKIVPSIYSYNEDAAKFVRVSMSLSYITESDAMKEPTTDIIQRYTRHDYYDYIIEIDENDEVIGGEWVGSSIQSHPDFLWLPTRARSGNPHVDIEVVRDLINQSREEEARELEFGSDEVAEIPDNDPEGIFTEVNVSDEGKLQSLKLTVEISHTYRGDLLVQLEKVDSQTVLIFDGYESERRWEDDVSLVDFEVAGFEGVDVQGTWRLSVLDSLAADTGELRSWKLSAVVK